jgi:hypothetical protein
MKRLLLALAVILFAQSAHAQATLYSNSANGNVGIGTSSPNAGAALDISNNSNSVLLPVGTTGTRPTGVNGMVRYNSTLNAIEGYINSAWSSLSTSTTTASAVEGTFKNLKITNGATPNNQMAITADAVMLGNGSGSYFVATSYSCTADVTTSGAGGLDTGTVAASTWYSEWVIYNGSTTSCLLSTSSTNPTMPTGYTYKARVGWNWTDGSNHFYRLLQFGRNAQYVITTGSNTTSIFAVITQISGNPNTPTWTAAQVQGNGFPVSPTASRVRGSVYYGGGNGSGILAPNGAYGNAASTANPPPICNCVGGTNLNLQFDFMLESNSVYYASDVVAGGVYVSGWEDNI